MFTSKKSLHIISTPQEYKTSLISFAQILNSLNNVESCAYINLSITNHQQISLLEQLFLRTKLSKEYPHINIDYYLLFKHEHITRGILSQAEYQNFHISKLFHCMSYFKYQVIIVDNVTPRSPYFSYILSIINASEIESQIILITSSQSILTHINTSIQTVHNYIYQEQLSQDSNTTHNAQPLLTINSIDEFSSWLSIAYHFTILKKNGSKRFFFISEQLGFTKEIFFLSILKKHLKQLNDFEQWDFMTSKREQHLKINSNNENNLTQLIYFIKQSLQVSGNTTILSSSHINDSVQTQLNSLITSTLHKNSLLITNMQVKPTQHTTSSYQRIEFKKS
ncbi:MAG: hypothetical protein ACLFPL_02565 [Candidatus Nanoarchaeia archaeon]